MRPGIALPVASAILLAVASAFRPGPAAAQFVPGDRDRIETKPKPEGCDETLTRPLPVENGIAQLRIVSPCRKGQTLAIQTDEATYEAAFDASGMLSARIPLFQELETLRWQGPDGQRREEQAHFPNIQRMVRIALIWKGDLTLSLRVNEKLTSLQGANCEWFQRGDTCLGLGRFEKLTAPSAAGTHVELYTLPLADVPRGARLTYRVFFDSQALSTTNPDYCGSGRWAEPAFEVLLLNNRTVARDRRLSAFRAVPCDGTRREPSVAKSEILLGP